MSSSSKPEDERCEMVSLFHKLLHQTWDAYKPATSNYHKNSTLLNTPKSPRIGRRRNTCGPKRRTPPPTRLRAWPGLPALNFWDSLPGALADSSLRSEILWLTKKHAFRLHPRFWSRAPETLGISSTMRAAKEFLLC